MTGRNVTNYTNEDYLNLRETGPVPSPRSSKVKMKGTTGIEPVTCGSAIRCSTAELSTHQA